MELIDQSFKVPFGYPVHFTQALFSVKNALFSDFLKASPHVVRPKLLFVIDSGLLAHHPTLPEQLQTYGQAYSGLAEWVPEPLIIPGGEQCKNDFEFVHRILARIDAHKIDRHSYLVAIGGGALLDLAGFAAAIAHRGVRHIRIPTTVLSQNDSGVGVKNSINYFGKKNFLGTFAPPVAVFNDYDFLTTLHPRDWRSGMAEAVKVALIKDAPFFESLQKDAPDLAKREMAAMKKLVYYCAHLHVAHIGGGDPFEAGSSRPLDFGHWSAHKLEYLTQYELRHGEAVAIGIALDCTYCYLKKMITQKEWSACLALLQALGFALFHPDLLQKDTDGQYEVLKGLEEFREHLGGRLTIMLLEGIGKGKEVHELDGETVLEAAQLLKEKQVNK